MSEVQQRLGALKTSIGMCEIDVMHWSPAPHDGFHSNFYTVMLKIGEVVGWYPVGATYLVNGLNRLLTIDEQQRTEVIFLERPNQYRDRYVRFDPRAKSPYQRFMCVQDGAAQLLPSEDGQLYFNTEPDGQFRWTSHEVMEAVDNAQVHEFAREVLKFIQEQTEKHP
jgi:hypothetical protein